MSTGRKLIQGSMTTTEYTGSIDKLFVTGSGTLLDIMFGDPNANPRYPLSSSAFADLNEGTIDALTVVAGQTIEGPIGRFKTGTACAIIYYKR